MKAVTKRLLRLEARFGPLMKAERTGAPSGAAQIAQWFDSMGVERESNESLAETTARAIVQEVGGGSLGARGQRGSRGRGCRIRWSHRGRIGGNVGDRLIHCVLHGGRSGSRL